MLALAGERRNNESMDWHNEAALPQRRLPGKFHRPQVEQVLVPRPVGQERLVHAAGPWWIEWREAACVRGTKTRTPAHVTRT